MLKYIVTLGVVLVASGAFTYGLVNRQALSGSAAAPVSGQPAPEMPSSTPAVAVTRAELKTHSTKESCWVGYLGEVYDITSWLPRHPGSSRAIEPFCGTAEEFTEAFNGQHGTGKDARLKREGTLIGNLVD